MQLVRLPLPLLLAGSALLSAVAACGGSGAGGEGGASATASGTGTSQATASGSAPSSSTSTTSSGAGGSGQGGADGAAGTPMFVAVGYGGRRLSSVDGIVWNNDIVIDPNGGDDDSLFRGVGFANGQFVAVGGAANGQNATSANGHDWAFHAPGSSWIADVVPLASALVIAGGNGLRQRSLDGGATWIDAADSYSGHYRGIASGNGLAIAAGHTYGDPTDQGLSCATSDGKTWSPEVLGGTPFHSIAFGKGLFVAAGDDRCSTSSDGKAWSDCSGVAGPGLDVVVFVNDRFVVGDGAGYFVSTDGLAWKHQAAEHHAVTAYGEGLYVALDWPDRILTSPDLAAWTVRQENTGPAFVQVAFGSVQP